ncbi:MAG TPA: DMT family transporter, partial [Wenzhouxiangella sp.]|nr:DMT family transporter [Wenzhouxiangella sp.]
YMCAGVFCLTINDAIAKWLGALYPIDVIVFFRMLFALPIIVAVGLMIGGRRALATGKPLIHMGRGLLATCGTFSFFLGLTLLPLAEVTAIAFASPLFVTLIAIPLLGERPGPGQWIATVGGFGGVLLIVQPGTEAFAIGALAPLGTALFYALLMLTARMLGRRETIWATMLYATVVPLVISGVLLPWFWKTPALEHLPWFMAAGLAGGVAMTLITQGFRIGVASVVAPFDYTGLVWAVAFGWMFWRETPSDMAIYGILVIVVCGIYLAYTHTRSEVRTTAPEPLHPPRGG